MNKQIILICALWFSAIYSGFAQDHTQKEDHVRQIADRVIRENIRGFVDFKTGEVYINASSLDAGSDIGFLNHFSAWVYPNGVVNIAMLELGDFLKEQKYIDYSLKNYDFIFDNLEYFRGRSNGKSKWDYPFGQMFAMELLDDCGAMGAGAIDAYHYKEREDSRDFIDVIAEFIMNDMFRLDDGTFCRELPIDQTIWADDLYMSVPFLARMGRLSGDTKYFDEAVRQVLQFTDYLWNDQTKLYHHAWYSDNEATNLAHWSRANGWVIMAQVELLKFLPADHPQRDELIDNLTRQILDVSRYQSISGLWRQLLDKVDSYLESSGTAMFTYATAFAVNEGFLPERYITVALNGWKGLMSVSDGGRVNNNSMGTGIQDDLNYYYTRHQRQNDVGFGAVILAGVEILKFESKHGLIKIENRHNW